MDLKELFGEEALTLSQFESKLAEKGIKLADLSTGNYVAKKKYEDEIASKDSAISDLKGQIKTRDNDIKDLKTQISEAGDDATKLADVTAQLEKLQGDYATAKNEYDAKLKKQGYEFAVREFANEQKFTSNAAKKMFINEMVNENLKMKDNTIIGADDFLKVYSEANADSFIVDEPEPTPEPEPGKPEFGKPTPPAGAAGDDTGFNFSFAHVR
jgi:chromosome segregation ATPase